VPNPKGGCIAIPKAYLSVVENNGGDLRMNHGGYAHHVEQGAAVGVRIGGRNGISGLCRHH
jgi:hypothetical protein